MQTMASAFSVTDGDNTLVIQTRASVRSWAVFVGCTAVGIGAALYAADCCLWKLIYVIMGLAVGAWFLDEYEEVSIDKSLKTVVITTQNAVQKLIGCSCCSRSETIKFDDVTAVQVDECDEKFAISFTLINSTVLTVCRSSSQDSRVECEFLVDRIHKLVQLGAKSDVKQLDTKTVQETVEAPLDIASEMPVTMSETAPAVQSDDASSVTSSEESFERINAADLAEYDAVIAETGNVPVIDLGPIVDPVVDECPDSLPDQCEDAEDKPDHSEDAEENGTAGDSISEPKDPQ